MKTQGIVPARLSHTEAGIPCAADYGDIYHPQAGALAQARHVFLAGNRLPARWQGRDRFTILETGFGLGNNFLATWQAWRADDRRSARLCFVSIEQHPLTASDLAAVQREPELATLADALVAAWPVLTPNLHRLEFDGGRVELLLALGDVQAWLPELLLRADAFYMDGFAPARNPRMWDLRVCKGLGRLAAPAATLATWSAARALRADLTTAGFQVRLGPGIGGKRDITLADYRGWTRAGVGGGTGTGTGTGDGDGDGVGESTGDGSGTVDGCRSHGDKPATATPRPSPQGPPHRALIVGAGLAGCSAAWALAELGWHSTVFEQGPVIAGAASGNPAGLFHGSVNRDDGVHTRLLRAAALEIRSVVATAVAAHGVAGATDGLLRLEAESTVDDMRRLLDRLGLPPGFVQARSAGDAAALCGLPIHLPAWFYPGGGWVDPVGLARSYLERAGSRVTVRTGQPVAAMRRSGGRWQLLDGQGRPIDDAEVVVLANAGDARRLLGVDHAIDWRSTRGQISALPRAEAPPPLRPCRLPVAGGGYLSPAPGGRLMFGATRQTDDADPAVRLGDHLENLSRLRTLTGLPLDDLSPEQLTGRTAWRCATADRLPLIGAAPRGSGAGGGGGAGGAAGQPADSAPLAGPIGGPLADSPAVHLADPFSIAREPGLYLYTALGSRGILWSALGARTLAAAITGGPSPIEASLQRAIDPARFIARALRRRQAAPTEGR